MIEICAITPPMPERWQDRQMVLRWLAAGMGEARRQFRPPAPARPAGHPRPEDRHRCHTDQGGCRPITRPAATQVPRRAGQPPATPSSSLPPNSLTDAPLTGCSSDEEAPTKPLHRLPSATN
jgi:hypothetical protein